MTLVHVENLTWVARKVGISSGARCFNRIVKLYGLAQGLAMPHDVMDVAANWWGSVVPLLPVGEIRCQLSPTCPPTEAVSAGATLSTVCRMPVNIWGKLELSAAFVETVARTPRSFRLVAPSLVTLELFDVSTCFRTRHSGESTSVNSHESGLRGAIGNRYQQPLVE